MGRNVSGQEDIIITMGIKLANVKAELNAFIRDLKSKQLTASMLGDKQKVKDLGNTIRKSQLEGQAAVAELTAGINNQKLGVQKYKKEFGALQQVLKKGFSSSTKQVQDFAGVIQGKAVPANQALKRATKLALDDMGRSLKKNNHELKKNKQEFSMWALSVMFFGQALKSTFQSIWRSSTKTFNDVVHSVEGAFTGFDMLKGAVTFLGFAVGQALEPVAFWLVPIIDKLSQWVIENEEIVRTILITIGVLGTLFATIGMGILSIEGFITGLTKVFKGLSLITGLPSATLVAIVAALVALAAISWKALSEAEGSVTAITDVFTTSLKNLSGGFLQNMKDLVSVVMGQEFEWEDLGWTIAWVFTSGIQFIEYFINTIGTLVSALTVVLTTLAEINEAIKFIGTAGLFGDMDFDVDKIADTFEILKKQSAEMSESAKLRYETPYALKAKYGDISVASKAGLEGTRLQYQDQAMSTAAGTSGQQTIVFNLDGVEFARATYDIFGNEIQSSFERST